ncbi:MULTISPECIES: hypothetical protein [Halorhodospira]|uniref:hypothetical protein n=1 Tax=Halorhodospira TaxID=85108 RepID=UPI0019123940|nr:MULTISPECIES: hypothetical protein [Halorhodospira]MBK5936588.1 hypothetical protein [Halorhodospira halophila]MBK5944305.1 hypothetical protein [Halorhodospira halophila]MCG5527574.1 hypothetical protein [Halorhodospira halophila]MCG5532593.1 hypothetical protein [Halorhodospira sp. 9621]MCG5539013.1 hypothetical protein [Halorhodospira sp. 9622]
MRMQNVERGPIARVAGVIGAIAVIALAATLGIVVLAVMLGLALIGAVIIAARTWWLRRQMRRAAARGEGFDPARRSGTPTRGRIIEGEYSRGSEDDPRHPRR